MMEQTQDENGSPVAENFDFLQRLLKGISQLFGPYCEVVLHDMTLPMDRTIVAIENGHVTHRKVGDSSTNMGLEVLRADSVGRDHYNYTNKTRDGKLLRSSSVYLTDKDNRVVGSVCINFDVTRLVGAEEALAHFTRASGGEGETLETFSGNIDQVLDDLIQRAIQLIGKPVDAMSREEKIECMKFLDHRGAFLVKKAGDKVSKVFRISKFTIYNYLNQERSTTDRV